MSKYISIFLLLTLCLAGCSFERTCEDVPGSLDTTSKHLTYSATGVALGALTGATIGSMTHLGPAGGAAIGGVAGGALGYHIASQALAKYQIQWIQLGDEVTVLVPTDKFFEPGSATLLPCAFPALNELAGQLKHYNKTPMCVIGHTDNLGDECYSLWLSRMRARSLTAYLWAHGIPSACMHPKGEGQYNPVANFQTVKGMRLNRYISISFRRCE